MPPKIKLSLYRGDDIAKRFRFTQGDAPYDTSQIARLDLQAYTETKTKRTQVLSLSSDDGIFIVDTGVIIVNFSHDMTDNATWSMAKYDLQATMKDGRIKTLVQGVISLTHDMTKRG
ncbi:hypothetical protein LU293_04140 [Moraxella nasovis]|uniref:hypothetical protein n=1 Tax=Moraxella nasovis TaxID=2904121 RepID=UPI001F61C646|nr:hypothetical protein [Moraxella nasovis]UNU74092.1 hypothetical protein LU293_04140 [Moraxella nasovis]